MTRAYTLILCWLRIVPNTSRKHCVSGGRSRNVVTISKEADLLIHDGTFLEEDDGKAHASASDAAEIAKKANVKQLILTHLSRRYSTKEQIDEIKEKAREIFPKTKVAYDGMKIKLKQDHLSQDPLE